MAADEYEKRAKLEREVQRKGIQHIVVASYRLGVADAARPDANYGKAARSRTAIHQQVLAAAIDRIVAEAMAGAVQATLMSGVLPKQDRN